MRKTDKKRDNQIREALNHACEDALQQVTGFVWLTHLVNYDNFPQSLTIVCVFDRKDQLQEAKTNGEQALLNQLIEQQLTQINLSFKNIAKHIHHDSEEECASGHAGNWAKRLSRP